MQPQHPYIRTVGRLRSTDRSRLEQLRDEAIRANILRDCESWPWFEELLRKRVGDLTQRLKGDSEKLDPRDEDRLRGAINALEWALDNVHVRVNAFIRFQQRLEEKATNG